jgi:cobalt-zinc-cadmium efflux system outer membrane protein
MRVRCSLALLLLVAIPAGAAWGTPLTQEELSAKAIAQSPVIQAMDHAIEAAKARALVSGARNNPSLVGQLQLSPTADHNQFTLGFRQLLDFRGLASQRRAQAEEEVEILGLQRARLTQEVGAHAKEAYWQAWLAKTELQRLTRDLDWQRDELNRARKRVEMGTASRHELIDAELDLLEAELAQRHAQQQAKGALARLNFLLGQEAEAELDLVSPRFEVGPLAPLSEWIGEAQVNRPEPRQVAIARRREVRGIRLAESLRFGEGELEAQAGTASNSDPLLLGSFDLPLPLWNGHEAERKAATADAARLDVELLASKQAISREVLAAYYEAVAARSRLVDVTERLIPHAEHLLEKADERLKLGAGNRAELLGARHAFSQAESDRAKAHLDYQLTLLRLQTAAGR